MSIFSSFCISTGCTRTTLIVPARSIRAIRRSGIDGFCSFWSFLGDGDANKVEYFVDFVLYVVVKTSFMRFLQETVFGMVA